MELCIEGITKKYDQKSVLENITHTFPAGSITGILGENGAGKTTLLRIISGITRPDAGRVRVENQDITGIVFPRMGVLLGGEVGLYQHLTAYENIEYFAHLHGIYGLPCMEKINYYAEQFHLLPYLRMPVKKLSRGNKQKTAIIRSIIHDPSILLFDEPELGLDFEASHIICQHILSSARGGKVVLYSSHSIGNILSLCQDAIVLHEGQLVQAFDVGDVQKRYSMSEAYHYIRQTVSAASKKQSCHVHEVRR